MYSSVVQDHFYNPRRVGPLPTATHTGTAGTPGEGPYVILWFEVEPNSQIVQHAAYRTFGCPAAIASASTVAGLVEGKTVSESIAQLDESAIVTSLEGLPEGKDHCPRLAIAALHNAFPNIK